MPDRPREDEVRLQMVMPGLSTPPNRIRVWNVIRDFVALTVTGPLRSTARQ